MAGAKNRSMLITCRTGSPTVWKISVVSSIHTAAERKNTLGTGKNERNKRNSCVRDSAI